MLCLNKKYSYHCHIVPVVIDKARMSSDMCRHSRFKGACQHLLGNLPALEEVYLLNFRSKRLQITKSTGMLGYTERLRALVLHTHESVVRVSSMTMPSQPSAEIYIPLQSA